MSDKNKSKTSTLTRAFTFITKNQNFDSNLNLYVVRRHYTDPQRECPLQQVHLIISSYYFIN